MCDKQSFDALKDLFNVDPSKFEKYKQDYVAKHIADLCADCPDRLERCQRFQWRIDQELAKHKNPIMRYNAMVEMFWKQVEEFKKAPTMPQPKKVPKPATIIRFGKKD